MKKKYNKNNAITRSGFDRRAADERRIAHCVNYFESGGLNRRIELERRNTGEDRDNWFRYSKWASVYIGE